MKLAAVYGLCVGGCIYNLTPPPLYTHISPLSPLPSPPSPLPTPLSTYTSPLSPPSPLPTPLPPSLPQSIWTMRRWPLRYMLDWVLVYIVNKCLQILIRNFQFLHKPKEENPYNIHVCTCIYKHIHIHVYVFTMYMYVYINVYILCIYI